MIWRVQPDLSWLCFEARSCHFCIVAERLYSALAACMPCQLVLRAAASKLPRNCSWWCIMGVHSKVFPNGSTPVAGMWQPHAWCHAAILLGSVRGLKMPEDVL